jgi:undecaprenyl-diphosphatase
MSCTGYDISVAPKAPEDANVVLELIQAILLGVVQGLTEFLPFSSSGHLLLAQYFLGVDQERFGLAFDASIHTGTVVAVIWFFRRDLLRMSRAFLSSLGGLDLTEPEQRMAYLVLAATIPAGVVGF